MKAGIFQNTKLAPLNVRPGFSTKIRYDINLAILTHCGDQNMHRIGCMKQFGVLNAGNYKVHITLIVNPGDFEKIDLIHSGWLATDDVSVLEMPSSKPIPKINGYYLWLMDSSISARWHGRVDDDSMTDVASALAYLDHKFGNSPVHVATGPMSEHEHEPLFVPFLLERGIFLQDTRTEYESSFTSKSGMLQIFSHELGKWLIEESGRRFTNPGDRALAFAAHLSGVPVVENTASRCWFEPNRFTLLGGDLHHIHYVPWHQQESLNWLTVYLSANSQKLTKDFVEELIGSALLFHAIDDSFALITLSSTKRVIGGEELKIASWKFAADSIHLYSQCGASYACLSQLVYHKTGIFLRGLKSIHANPCLLHIDTLTKDVKSRRRRAYPQINNSSRRPTTGYYLRLGERGRLLRFENSGVISEGADACEKTWALTNVGDKLAFEIKGDAGITCRLFACPDGIWRGRWVIANRSPVAIIMMDQLISR